MHSPRRWLWSSPKPPPRSSAVALLEQVGPVSRYPSSRTGNGLVDRPAVRCREFGPVVVLVGLVVPEPVLARFERPDDRVPARPPVRRRVSCQRVVTATDMAADRAAPQVHPPAARGVTLDTTGSARRNRGIDDSAHNRRAYRRRRSLTVSPAPSTEISPDRPSERCRARSRTPGAEFLGCRNPRDERCLPPTGRRRAPPERSRFESFPHIVPGWSQVRFGTTA